MGRYESRSFWWGFVGGAAAAYAFVFLTIFAISVAFNLDLRNVSLVLMIVSALFALFILLGKVRDSLLAKGRR